MRKSPRDIFPDSVKKHGQTKRKMICLRQAVTKASEKDLKTSFPPPIALCWLKYCIHPAHTLTTLSFSARLSRTVRI